MNEIVSPKLADQEKKQQMQVIFGIMRENNISPWEISQFFDAIATLWTTEKQQTEKDGNALSASSVELAETSATQQVEADKLTQQLLSDNKKETTQENEVLIDTVHDYLWEVVVNMMYSSIYAKDIIAGKWDANMSVLEKSRWKKQQLLESVTKKLSDLKTEDNWLQEEINKATILLRSTLWTIEIMRDHSDFLYNIIWLYNQLLINYWSFCKKYNKII